MNFVLTAHRTTALKLVGKWILYLPAFYNLITCPANSCFYLYMVISAGIQGLELFMWLCDWVYFRMGVMRVRSAVLMISWVHHLDSAWQLHKLYSSISCSFADFNFIFRKFCFFFYLSPILISHTFSSIAFPQQNGKQAKNKQMNWAPIHSNNNDNMKLYDDVIKLKMSTEWIVSCNKVRELSWSGRRYRR